MHKPDSPDPKPRHLIEYFEEVPDPRVKRQPDHKLVDILFIGLCTMLTIGENFTDMEDFGNAKHAWFKKFLELPRGIPSHDTFNRVFSAIDPRHFLDIFVQWVQGVGAGEPGEVVAIDGKALRRALDEGDSMPHIVSAWATENGLTLGQVKVDDKSNEITAIPELLRVLELKGCIVTIDAMGCQKTVANEIVNAGADYVLALKNNHPTVLEEVAGYFEDALARQTGPSQFQQPMDGHETLDKGHGRIEQRRYYHTTDIAWFADKHLWPGLQSIGMVESVRHINGQSTLQRRYYLSSLEMDASNFARAVRGHWGVENPLHWSLDVTFGEDQSRARTKFAAQNLATLRRLCLNLIKSHANPKKRSVRRQKRIAALSEDYLEELLGLNA